ncbi:MAG: hypothetical protein HYU57_03510 [Micavibrio aeruginosavorus]|nr:hypothetical protein [Micavibrio aeruginosavorus]
MWFFIWILLSVFIIGVTAWSLRILLAQRAAWQSFAKKNNLNFRTGRSFFVSPVVSGTLGPYGFGLFSEERPTGDARGSRFNTVIEIALRQGMPVPGVIGTAEMAPVIESLDNLTQTLTINDPEWDSRWLIRSTDSAAMEKFLTPARRDVIKKIFRMKIMAALFIFDDKDAVFRLETADPLHNLDRLEKIVRMLIQQVEVMLPEKPAAPAQTESAQP